MPRDESQPPPTFRPDLPPMTEPPDTVRNDSSRPSIVPQLRTDGPLAPSGFTLIDEIGRGGMGVVYSALDAEVGREVAVKLLRPEYLTSPTASQRFVEEARITGQLQHPGIPAVYRVGTMPDGSPFLAMKLVKGRTLADLLRGRESPATDRGRFVAAFEGICQAVGYAHAHGVIHRDLKPQNVMVGAFGEVQVMDWGLAKVLTSGGVHPRRTYSPSTDTDPASHIRGTRQTNDETSVGSIMGTPAYMPPEQAIGAVDKIDRRSDVFGLGGILCAILTGKPPYISESAESTRQLAAQVKLADAFARLDTSDADPDLVTLCKRCLNGERDARPADAGAVATAVASLRAAADERARQAELEREREAVRADAERKRRRARRAATGLVVGALSIGMGLAFWQMNRADVAAADALAKRDVAEAARAQTREALDAMTSSVTGDSLTTQKAISPEQAKFLTDVLSYYKAFAAEAGQDELARSRTAAAAFRVGHIEYRLGRKAEGEAAFRQARDGYDGLVADFPAVPDYRSNLAKSHTNFGALLTDLGKWAEAEAEYRAGLTLNEKLAADFPAVPEYRSNLAGSHGNLGVLLKDLGKRAEAEAAYRAGLAIHEKLAADFPAVPEYRRDLAASHTNLGGLLAGLGRRAEAEAEAAYRAGLAIHEKLATDFPAVPEYRHDLAANHTNLGGLLAGVGRRSEAEAAYRAGLALNEKLAADFPAVPEYRSKLARSDNNLGALLFGLGRRSEAEVAIRAGLALREKLAADFPAVPEYRHDLAESHTNLGVLLNDLGRRSEAEAAFRAGLAIQGKLAADFPAALKYRVNLGGNCSNFGILVRDAGRANDSLGWFDQAIRTLTPVHEQEPRAVTPRLFLGTSHWNRALALMQLNRHADAVADWDKALVLGDGSAREYFQKQRAICVWIASAQREPAPPPRPAR